MNPGTIIKQNWFTHGDIVLQLTENAGAVLPACIGIIVAADSQGNPRAYIGIGKGKDPEEDAKAIIKCGGKFPVELAMKLP
jgi:hypothetical protein